MLKKLGLVFAVSLLTMALYGQSANFAPTAFNLNSNAAAKVPLRSLTDRQLQASLFRELRSNEKWRNLIDQKKMAIGLVDLRNPSNVKFAHINGNQMMYAASLPKIAILLAAMDALEKGELKESPEVLHDMKIMISRSDNQASTRMIDRLGYKKIEKVLTDPKYRLYDKNYGGGLWVGKRYASQGARYPDPILGLSHAATASQVCRFYYLLATGQLVSTERSAQMLDIMKDPELHHKFVNTLDRVAPRADVYRKSGSWRTYHADSALVEGPDRHYILVALVDDPEGEAICRQMVTAVEKVIQIRRPTAVRSSK
ncbi:serine hydrolase [Flavilitoribacter nigricans]|nr:serine hydrolase [Flavilitoribacter nigricans]